MYKIDDNFEKELISDITKRIVKGNIDNISRTKSYYKYYVQNPEIEWSFLASMVSRNAGWNITDLQGFWLPQLLPETLRAHMFHTYERANWLIFLDAFPQLLIYERSKQYKTSFFHLLKNFHVSQFMQREWQRFWKTKDRKRLMTALIINEQNVIQNPVIGDPFYKKKVFQSIPYKIQNWLHYSVVVFPTVKGELYGFSVHEFSSINERIQLGKKLAWLLFHPDYHHAFRDFSDKTEHTGSRYDYEQYFRKQKKRDTPFLRTAFPIVEHHRHDAFDWYQCHVRAERWFKPPIRTPKKFRLTKWYKKKQNRLHALISLSNLREKRG